MLWLGACVFGLVLIIISYGILLSKILPLLRERGEEGRLFAEDEAALKGYAVGALISFFLGVLFLLLSLYSFF